MLCAVTVCSCVIQQLVFHSSCDTTRLLVSLGADTSLVDNEGNSALHHASINLNFVSTRVLLEASCPLEIKNKDVRIT